MLSLESQLRQQPEDDRDEHQAELTDSIEVVSAHGDGKPSLAKVTTTMRYIQQHSRSEYQHVADAFDNAEIIISVRHRMLDPRLQLAQGPPISDGHLRRMYD